MRPRRLSLVRLLLVLGVATACPHTIAHAEEAPVRWRPAVGVSPRVLFHGQAGDQLVKIRLNREDRPSPQDRVEALVIGWGADEVARDFRIERIGTETDVLTFRIRQGQLPPGVYRLYLDFARRTGDGRVYAQRLGIDRAFWVLGALEVKLPNGVVLTNGGDLPRGGRCEIALEGVPHSFLRVTVGGVPAFTRIADSPPRFEFRVPDALAEGTTDLVIEAALPPLSRRERLTRPWTVRVTGNGTPVDPPPTRQPPIGPGPGPDPDPPADPPSRAPEARGLTALSYPEGGSPGAVEIVIAGESFRFVRVPRGVYAMGLTKEQAADPYLAEKRLAPASSSYDGAFPVPLVHPFFLQETEVTNAQYWAWRRARVQAGIAPPHLPAHLQAYGALATALPGDVAQEPVRGVSFDEAAAFARWVDDSIRRTAPRWSVRLPHEVEWEMAARGDERRYAFPDREADRALPSLTGSARPRPVRSRPLDCSWVGVADLTASVGEWTATVFDEQFLERLQLHIRSGRLEGWDPRPGALRASELVAAVPDDPRASVNLCVRGGANGERPELMQVSVRRQWERKGRHEGIGFRLLLVCEDGP